MKYQPNTQGAIDVVKTEYAGDWARCPLRWPEIHTSHLIPDSQGALKAKFVRIDVPKENYHFRPAVILPPTTRVMYQAVANTLLTRPTFNVPDFAYGWRPDLKGKGMADNDEEWKRFMKDISESSDAHEYLLKLDISSFFASINTDIAAELLANKGVGEAVKLFREIIETHERCGRKGLPQRSLASSLIAHLVMEVTDQSILTFHARGIGRVHRWMDDIWVFASSEAKCREVQRTIIDRLRENGLELNSAKTRLYAGDDAKVEAKSIGLSGIEVEFLRARMATKKSPNSKSNLTTTQEYCDLIAKFQKSPENVDRTLVSFLRKNAKGLARPDAKQIAKDLLPFAHRIHQAADQMGLILSQLKLGESLNDWYFGEYLKNGVVLFDWAKTGMLHAVRYNKFEAAHRQTLVEIIDSSPDSLLAADAAWLLAENGAKEVVDVLRTKASDTKNWWSARMFTLSLVKLGTTQRDLKNLLRSRDDLDELRSYLEHKNFRI